MVFLNKGNPFNLATNAETQYPLQSSCPNENENNILSKPEEIKNFLVKELGSGASIKDFLKVPNRIYRDDKNFVPPLMFERREVFSKKNNVFNSIQWQGWVAYVDSQPVARITAHIDYKHLDRYNDGMGFFGFIEGPNNYHIFQKMFEIAENWLKERGVRRVRGPFNFTINQELGILVDGFDTPPYIMMTHALPYYGPLIESLGYSKGTDLLAYLIDAEFETPKIMAKLLRRLLGEVTIRSLDKKNKIADLDTIRDIFNDAWEDNWGFIPFERQAFRKIGEEMLMLIPPDFIQIAEIDGEPVAFIVLLPNINEAIADLNGKLLPFGWLKLIWRLKFRYPQTARIPLMGVRKRYHNTRYGPGLALSVVDALRAPGIAKGLKEIEMSWILDDNSAMKNIISILGGRLSKRYRVYEKDLSDQY